MIEYTPKQLEVTNILNDNLQIIACAGSGKTQVISQRIVNLVKNQQDIEPKCIVAFTYTEKAAAELKTRILKLFKEQLPDQKGLVDMYIGTIHSWCLKILQEHAYEYQKFSVLDEIKLKLFVDRNYYRIGMRDLDMERYRDTEHYCQLMSIVRESELNDDEELQKILSAMAKYEDTLTQASYFDFTMIMTKVYQHLQDDDVFREKIGNSIKYLIVDEYQDVNPIQEKIINFIANLGANICVVGDDDQTIYQWRGSDVGYIIGFQNRYNNVKSVTLSDNFRSSNGIVDLAQKVITNNNDRLVKEMTTRSHQVYEQGDILYSSFDDVDAENQYIADMIKTVRGMEFVEQVTNTGENITRGLDYSDCAILLRKWKKAQNLIHILEENDIPFIVGGVNELFSRPEVKAAIQIFYYLNSQVDKSVIIEYWSSLSMAISIESIEKAVASLNKKKPGNVGYYADFVLQEIYFNFLDLAGINEDVFVDDGSGSTAGNNREEIIFYNLGMFSQVIDDFESIHFMDQPTNKLANFLSFLKYSAEEEYAEGWLNNNYKTPNAVQIMTVYQAKGLEFPVVFVPGMNRNYLPSQKKGGVTVWHHLPRSLIQGQQRYEGSEQDERRLLYVAITRSQKFLFITRAPDGRNQKKESSFVPEIKRSVYIFENKQRDYSDRPRKDPQPRQDTNNILLNFSVLKNFFDCPYLFKLVSMYGFIYPLNMRIGYGRSVHNILMEIHKNALDGIMPDPNNLDALLDRHVHIPYAYPDVVDDVKKKAKAVVTEYIKLNKDDFANIEFAEKDIQIDLDHGILINGRVDLIKKKDINGNTKTYIVDIKSSEDAQTYEVTMEQLALYAIGYQELSGEKADFLQIYNMDKNCPETKEIQISDMDAMREKITSAADFIRTNKLPKTTNAKKCDDCWRHKMCSGAPQEN
jgi:DNA helicase-2/ATP-dependent DNA helicase PcrA